MYGTIEGGADERDPFVGREALEARVRRLAVCNYCSVEVLVYMWWLAFVRGCILRNFHEKSKKFKLEKPIHLLFIYL